MERLLKCTRTQTLTARRCTSCRSLVASAPSTVPAVGPAPQTCRNAEMPPCCQPSQRCTRTTRPRCLQVPLQPDVSGSPASTPTRQGLGSPIRFLSKALSSINPLRRGSEDRTPRGSAPSTLQGLSVNVCACGHCLHSEVNARVLRECICAVSSVPRRWQHHAHGQRIVSALYALHGHSAMQGLHRMLDLHIRNSSACGPAHSGAWTVDPLLPASHLLASLILSMRAALILVCDSTRILYG